MQKVVSSNLITRSIFLPLSDSRLKLFRCALALATCVFLTLALRPGMSQPVDSLPHMDKLEHFGAFVLFAFLAQGAFPKLPTWVKIGVLAAIGLGVELGQMEVPHRNFSVGDLLANCAGIGVFFAARGWRKQISGEK